MSTSSRSSSRASSDQGGKTPEQIAAQEDQAPTEDQTPVPAATEATQTDSRYNMLRDTPPPERKSLVWIAYRGRKARGSVVRRTADEHIDVIVPDESNEGAVASYLDQSAPGGTLSDKALEQLAEAGISHETIQLSGTHYHHYSGEPTPVHPDHVDWHLNHKNLAFEQVDPPGRA